MTSLLSDRLVSARRSNICRITLLLIISTLLQSCMDMCVTGAQCIYNRQSLAKNFTDQYITMQAHQNLYIKTDEFKNTHIAIATYNGDLLLAGQVPFAWQKSKAEALVKDVPDVKQIYNLVTVQTPSSTLTRMSDSWITTKIKAKLVASSEVDSKLLKVVTENGIVYLMGTLQPQEAKAAVDIAKETDGVQGVVKIFSYVTITKNKPASLYPQEPPSAPEATVQDERPVEPLAAAQAGASSEPSTMAQAEPQEPAPQAEPPESPQLS